MGSNIIIIIPQLFIFPSFPMLENWRVLCSPAMFDDEDTLVHVKIEFDMRASRKDRYLDPFHKMMPIIKTYDRKVPNRNVVCFVPTEELRLEVLQNGAAMAGGTELIKDIQMGRVDIVSFLICEKKKLQINFYKIEFSFYRLRLTIIYVIQI